MGLFGRMPAEDRRRLRRRALWVGGGIAVLIAFFVWLDVQDAKEREVLAPWAAMVRSHMLAAKQPVEALEPGGGYVTGRVIAVDFARLAPDRLHLQLNPNVRSATPTDVGTIVWLEYGQRQVGTYEGGDPAYVRTATVTVIDKAKNAIVARTVVEGGPPPERKKPGGAGVGSYPGPQILQYIHSLRKR